MDRRTGRELREEVEDEIRRYKGYLKALDMFEKRDKTRFKEYYRDRISVAEEVLQSLVELENENK